MWGCWRWGAWLWLVALQAGGLTSAKETPTQDLTYRVGDTATLLLEIPPGSNISNLLWRSSSRGSSEAVASWQPGTPLTVLNPGYLGRVDFLEGRWALEIRNLTLADGGCYEVVELQDPLEVTLKQYNLVVIGISTTGMVSGNGSCSFSLECKAGAGARDRVEYSWGPGLKGPVLPVILHPGDKEKSFTCTATALGTRHSLQVSPYEEACSSSSSATRAAGLLLARLLGPLLLLLVVQ
ncbi:SLAM family member 9-like [Paroedura picta]|uniref:SLAM family member 9-like n=1 Tax=Paroedura picta TaxID=143630 RepID=UPI00405687DF